MSLLSDEISRAFDEVTRTTVATDPAEPASTTYIFTWKGTDYTALSIVLIQQKLFGPGGFTLDDGLTITVRADAFASDTPLPEQRVTYKTKLYRIDIVKPSPDGTGIVLVCNDVNRGAGIVEREM